MGLQSGGGSAVADTKITLEDLTRDELLAWVKKSSSDLPQADLLSLKHASAQETSNQRFAAEQVAWARYVAAIDARGKAAAKGRADRSTELAYLAACSVALEAEEAHKRARKASQRAEKEENRLWAAWSAEVGL